MKLTLIFYHKIKRMTAPWGIIITEESEHRKPYLQMGYLGPWWNMNIDPTSVIVTLYITSIATYHNSSVVRTAKFYHCWTPCCHLYSSTQLKGIQVTFHERDTEREAMLGSKEQSEEHRWRQQLPGFKCQPCYTGAAWAQAGHSFWGFFTYKTRIIVVPPHWIVMRIQ